MGRQTDKLRNSVRKRVNWIRGVPKRVAFNLRSPAIARRYRLIKRECLDPNYLIRSSEALKVVYAEVPKAASTTIHLLLNGLAENCEQTVRGADTSKLTKMDELGPETFFRLADNPDTLTFTFVRNPYDRILSTYRDKFLRCPLGVEGGMNHEIREYFGSRIARFDAAEPLPFPAYVDMVVETCATTGDPHRTPMDRLLPRNSLKFDFIGRVEAFEQDIQVVYEHLGIEPRDIRANRTNNTDYFDPDTRAKIARAFQVDFERFEYST